MTHPIDKFFSLVNNNNSSEDEIASRPGFELDSTFSDETDTAPVPVSIGKVVEDPSELEPGDTVVATAAFRPIKENNGHGKLNITDESRRACAEAMLGYRGDSTLGAKSGKGSLARVNDVLDRALDLLFTDGRHTESHDGLRYW